jgi:hypothetical protein
MQTTKQKNLPLMRQVYSSTVIRAFLTDMFQNREANMVRECDPLTTPPEGNALRSIQSPDAAKAESPHHAFKNDAAPSNVVPPSISNYGKDFSEITLNLSLISLDSNGEIQKEKILPILPHGPISPLRPTSRSKFLSKKISS